MGGMVAALEQKWGSIRLWGMRYDQKDLQPGIGVRKTPPDLSDPRPSLLLSGQAVRSVNFNAVKAERKSTTA